MEARNEEKLAVIKVVSHDRGVIAAAVMDQRGTIQKAAFCVNGAKSAENRAYCWAMKRPAMTRLALGGCVKVLLYYAPTDGAINDKEHAWVGFIGTNAAPTISPTFLNSWDITKGIDVMKVGVPVNTKFVEGAVSKAELHEALALAAQSGVKFNGVLCGRTTWKEGIPVYAKQGAKAFEQWLLNESLTTNGG